MSGQDSSFCHRCPRRREGRGFLGRLDQDAQDQHSGCAPHCGSLTLPIKTQDLSVAYARWHGNRHPPASWQRQSTRRTHLGLGRANRERRLDILAHWGNSGPGDKLVRISMHLHHAGHGLFCAWYDLSESLSESSDTLKAIGGLLGEGTQQHGVDGR